MLPLAVGAKIPNLFFKVFFSIRTSTSDWQLQVKT